MNIKDMNENEIIEIAKKYQEQYKKRQEYNKRRNLMMKLAYDEAKRRNLIK